MKSLILVVVFFCSMSFALSQIGYDLEISEGYNTGFGYNLIRSNNELPPIDKTGWVEFIDNEFNSTNPLTISAGSSITFNMTNYDIRSKEIPQNTVPSDYFNGTHVLIKTAGSSFLERWRYQYQTNTGSGGYCIAEYHIGGGVPELVIRTIRTPRSNGVPQRDQFTNLQYGIDTWERNGANITISCYNQDFEFWDIDFTIEPLHEGRGDYS